MTADMRARIREADIREVGYAYMRHAGLGWLSWPLQTPEMSHADWFTWIVRTVARAPVCGRTVDQVLAELGRIDHVGLSRILPQVAALIAMSQADADAR